MRWPNLFVAMLLTIVATSDIRSETLEDCYGDGSSSGCTANATAIEQKILDRGSEAYGYPLASESAAILAAVDALVDRDPDTAHAEATFGGYRVSVFFDDARQRELHLLEPDGPGNPGHGYFVFDLHGNRNIVIQAPHVGFDTRTVDFALQAHATLEPFALLIPGSDRYANHDCDGCSSPCNLNSGADNSDVTRTELSLFHQVHQRLLDRLGSECRRVLVVQFHGFGTSTQSSAGCGFDFILSDGDGNRISDPPHLTRIGERLEEHTNDGTGDPQDAYTWNVASSGGGDCSGLLATFNRQGASTRAAGALFAHVEMDRNVRAWPDAADAQEIADALAETMLGALELTARRGSGGDVILEWQGGIGDETLYRSPSAADFCNQATAIPAPSGSLTDQPGPGLFFYRVE